MVIKHELRPTSSVMTGHPGVVASTWHCFMAAAAPGADSGTALKVNEFAGLQLKKLLPSRHSSAADVM